VPGPFLELLIEAKENDTENFMLIIEEINRANVSSVFGDVFQLLDRDKNGESEYDIDFNSEISTYLASHGISGKIRIPDNLFIWATMNSADQGVMPLDAAFKRRWSFEYLSIDANKSQIVGRKIIFQGIEYSWNKFRVEINNALKDLLVPEDKLLGPFFMSENELINEAAIKNKLLLYLRDDVVRHNPTNLFTTRTFSDIMTAYQNNQIVFNSIVNPSNWHFDIPVDDENHPNDPA